MINLKWRDFRLSSGAPIVGVDERFDLEKEGRVVRRDLVEKFGDKFEAMEVTDIGGIVIWTTAKVWCVRKEQDFEKLINLPRNPSAGSR